MDTLMVIGVIALCAILFVKLEKAIFKILAVLAIIGCVVYVIPNYFL